MIHPAHSTITKTSGQFGTTNPIIHKEDITEGKNLGRSNETTPYEQAVSQAESDWKKKKDEGYKTLNDLQVTLDTEGYSYLTVNGTVEEKFGPNNLDLMLEKVLPKFNTDASGNIKPMLATDIEKIKKVEYPVYVQPKLDGFRCLIIVKDGTVTLLSRSGKTFNLPHIERTFTGNSKFSPDLEFVLDGELYMHGVTFQAISKAIKKPNELTPKIQYHCYDVVDFDLNQMDRLAIRNQLISMFSGPNDNPLHCLDGVIAHNIDEVKDLHDRWVTLNGYEGAMVRLQSGKYVSSRSRELMKVKQFNDEEFACVGWELGQRGSEDLIAICLTEDGKQFRAKMQGTREHKAELLAKGVPASAMLTVKFFGYSEDNIPRFPVGKAFRDE